MRRRERRMRDVRRKKDKKNGIWTYLTFIWTWFNRVFESPNLLRLGFSVSYVLCLTEPFIRAVRDIWTRRVVALDTHSRCHCLSLTASVSIRVALWWEGILLTLRSDTSVLISDCKTVEGAAATLFRLILLISRWLDGKATASFFESIWPRPLGSIADATTGFSLWELAVLWLSLNCSLNWLCGTCIVMRSQIIKIRKSKRSHASSAGDLSWHSSPTFEGKSEDLAKIFWQFLFNYQTQGGKRDWHTYVSALISTHFVIIKAQCPVASSMNACWVWTAFSAAASFSSHLLFWIWSSSSFSVTSPSYTSEPSSRVSGKLEHFSEGSSIKMNAPSFSDSLIALYTRFCGRCELR